MMNGKLRKVLSVVIASVLLLSSTSISIYAKETTNAVLELAVPLQQYNNNLAYASSDFIIENGVLKSYNGQGGDVVIPDNVKSIAANAFRESVNRGNITSITIPDSVTEIGNRAFQDCQNLISVTIGSGVATLGEAPFFYCLKLKEIKTSSNNPYIKSVDGVLFSKDMTTLLAFPNGKAGDYTIPDGVKTLANRAFCWSGELTNLKIPDSITTFEYYSLALCGKLSTVEFDGDCAGLTSIKDVFNGSNNLSNLTISKNVSDLSAGQFADNTKLSDIKVSPENQYYSASDNVLFNKDKSKLILSPKTISGEYHVSAGVAEIGPAAFSNCTGLKGIYIPLETTKIGDPNAYYGVFTKCSNLTIHGDNGSAAQKYAAENSILFTDETGNNFIPVTGIQMEQASLKAKVGQSVQITAVISPENAADKSVTWESGDTAVATVDSSGLVSCVGPGHAAITAKTRDGGFSAFCVLTVSENNSDFVIVDGVLIKYLGNSLDVVIPDEVTSIGDRAFEKCSLKRVTIPDGVTRIGDYAFFECNSLMEINIPDSVTGIGEHAFDECMFLSSLFIPDSTTSIGNMAFFNCVTLTSIDVDSKNPSYSSLEGVLYNKSKTTLICYPSRKTGSSFTVPGSVTEIAGYAFSDARILSGITIPDSVANIGQHAFEGCSNLSNIVIPHSITSISSFCFFGCSKLTSVTIPDSVTNIGESAFSICALTNVSIPDSVTSIGTLAFAECNSLTAVVIPKNVTHIGDMALNYCSNLRKIVVNNQNTAYSSTDGVLYDKSKKTLITYPTGKTDSSFTVPESVSSIYYRAFEECTNLTSVTIPKNVTFIGSMAFYNCPNITINGYAGSCAEAFAHDNGIPFTAIYVEENPFDYSYNPPKVNIPDGSQNVIADNNNPVLKPGANNIAVPSGVEANITGDLRVSGRNFDTNGVNFKISGDIIVENGRLTISRLSMVSATNIRIGTRGVVVVEGKLTGRGYLDMYGGTSSSTPGGLLSISGGTQYSTTGVLECGNIQVRDYASLALKDKANLISSENITVQNKIKNDLDSGNIWFGGSLAQINGGWFNQGADNFQAGTNLSVILYDNTILNGVKNHKLEFQSKSQSWLNNFYIQDKVWDQIENKTRSFSEKNTTVKGRSTVIKKYDNAWNFSQVTAGSRDKQVQEIQSTIEGMVQTVRGRVENVVLSYGIPELGDMNSKANKDLAMVAIALGASFQYYETAQEEIYKVYSEADITIKYNRNNRNIKLICEGVEVYGQTAAAIKYSFDGGMHTENYGTLLVSDLDQEFAGLYNYATGQYKEAISSLLQVPLIDIFEWAQTEEETALTNLFFEKLCNSTGESVVRINFPKLENKRDKSTGFLGSYGTNATNNSAEKIAFDVYPFVQAPEPPAPLLNQDMEDSLKEAICDELGIQSFEEASPEDLASIKSLNLTNKSITSLAGVERLVNLETLSMSGNYVSDLTPISGLSKLRELNISGNDISSIAPLENLTSLTSLKMSNNYCGDISPIAKLRNLEILDISNNNISTIGAVGGFTNIKTLYMSGNPLSDKSLNALAGSASLETLAASSCNLEDIGAIGGKPLVFADLSNNSISDIISLNSPALKTANFSNNMIRDISTLRQMKDLVNLDLSSNEISSIEGLSSLEKLTSLYIGNNPIAGIIELKSLTQLEKLDLSSIEASDFGPVAFLNNLKELGICNTKLYDLSFLNGKGSLRKLALSNCGLDDFSIQPIFSLTSLKDLDLSYNYICNRSPFSSLKKLQSLNLDNNFISEGSDSDSGFKAGLTRLAGSSRIDTALEIAKASYKGQISDVILATSENFPDALAGSVLAYKVNAPILLIGSAEEEQDKVISYIKDHMSTGGTVYILGGGSVVSVSVEEKIASNGFSHIIRLGGTDRYETALQIADQLDVKTGTPVVLVYGENYPDALSISSTAASMQYPIFLVEKDDISDSVKKKIAEIKPSKVYIIGLQAVISTNVEEQVSKLTGLYGDNIIRLGGMDRFETSLAVSKYFNLAGQNVCIATGNDFPDALTGSVYAANLNAPIILTDTNLSSSALSYLRERKNSGVTIFGGEAVVNKEVEQEILNILAQ